MVARVDHPAIGGAPPASGGLWTESSARTACQALLLAGLDAGLEEVEPEEVEPEEEEPEEVEPEESDDEGFFDPASDPEPDDELPAAAGLEDGAA